MTKKDRYINTLFGLEIDCIRMEEVLKRVSEWVKGSKKRYVVTPNPEMVMEAVKDDSFKKFLNKADLKIPDGAGLVWAINKTFRSGTECSRVAGADVMMELCKLAAEKKWRVCFLGGERLVAKKAAEKMRSKHDGLEIRGLMGLEKVNEASEKEKTQVIEEINAFKPDLLFVGFGHGKQERWIAENLHKLRVKVAMGVGGSFDYLVKPWLRAPKWVQRLGLEWFYRLVCQPWRIKRQLKLIEFVKLCLNGRKTGKMQV